MHNYIENMLKLYKVSRHNLILGQAVSVGPLGVCKFLSQSDCELVADPE